MTEPSERVPYKRGGISLALGRRFEVELPAAIFRARLTGLLFDTSKCFLLPSAIHGMRALKRLFDEHKNLQLLVTGHTDRAGSDGYNLALSSERAQSMSAFLRDAVDEWTKFYGKGIAEEKRWGAREDGLMLGQVVPADKLQDPGSPQPASAGNVRAFQQFSNDTRGTSLATDGKIGQETRRELVAAYMAQPGTSLPKDAVLLTHGCGPFHNEVPTGPGAAEQRNRRAEIFFFEGPVKPPPRKPCPGPKGCPEYPEWVKRTTKTIDLDRGVGNLTVQVQDPAGAAIEGASVHLEGPFSEEGKTDASGLASFPDLPAGSYTVSAAHEGFEEGKTSAALGDGSQVTAKLSLKARLFDFDVLVQSEAKEPVQDAVVEINATGVASAKTNKGGIARLTGVPGGTFQLTARHPGFNEGLVETPVPPARTKGKTADSPAADTAPGGAGDEPVPVQLQSAPATLVVKVVDATAKPPALPQPIGGATVRVLPASGGAEQSKKTNDKSDKAHAGEARFENLAPGAATVRVQADGFKVGQAQPVLTGGATTSVEVALQAATGTVVVTVTDDLGAAVDDKDVIVTVQPPGSAKALTAPTVKGKARIEDVPPGKSRIIASKPGFADGETTADVLADQAVEKPVQLKRQLGELTVTVATPTGDLLQDAVVVLERGKDHREARTLKSGETPPFKDVPVGKWKLSARLDGFGAAAAAEIEIKTGAGQKQTVTLTPAVVPEIAPASLVVVVKKPGCNPARKEVTLRLKSGSLTGGATGRLTRSDDSVKLFTAGGAEITNNANNTFSAAQLNAGVKVLAEGATASKSLDAKDLTELKLELLVGNNAIGAPVTAKVTCVELKLDLFQSRTSRADPAPMAAAQKTARGRFLHVQDPGLHQGRAWIVVREVLPAKFAQNLQLQVVPASGGAATGAVQLRLQEQPAPGEAAAVALPRTITPDDLKNAPQVAGSKGLAFFVEGQTASKALRDVQLQLGIQGGEADGDRAAFTVVRFTKLQATIPSTQALVDRTAQGFPNTPVQNTVVTHATGAIASADFDESYAASVPIVMIENSLPAGAAVQLQVTVEPPNTPVSWSRLRDTRPAGAAEGGGDANGVINPVPAPANTRPTLTATAGTPTIAKANLLADSVGSFRVRAFVDENGSNEFERDASTADSFAPEPYILMNFLLVRVVGVNNLSVCNNGANLVLQSAAGGPPVGNANVIATTGNMTSGPNAGVWARASVNVIAGGSNGLRGLDRVYGGWIQEIVPTAGSPAPGGNTMDWGADYRLTVPNPGGGPPAVQVHHVYFLMVQQAFQTFLPPPAPQPTRMALPMLDVTPFANAGMGGGLASGMGAQGPNNAPVPKVAIPPAAPGGASPPGQQWTIEMWDPPGIPGFPSTHSGFPAAQMIAFRMNVDFQHDLCFWTNNQAAAAPLGNPTVAGGVTPISAPGVGPPDPACCLYASVQTNRWTVRLSVTFSPVAPFAMTVVTPFATAMTKDASPTRLARPVQNLEVRFPPAQPRISYDATT